MPKYEIKRENTGRSSNECYQAGLRAVKTAGYTIIKKRDIALLAICQTLIQGCRVDLNLMVPLGKPTTVILNFSSERADEASLKLEANRLLGILVKELEL